MALSLTLKRTKWLFFALCCYLLSQSFTIPIFAIGPSWAIWPTLSDLATGLLVLTFLLNISHTPVQSKANRNIFYILILICLGCILSVAWNFTWQTNESTRESIFGVFQIYRLVEFICIFWITARIPLTPERINLLKQIVETVLIFVCAGVVLTYFSILPLSALTAHLPYSFDIAGPWASYAHAGRLESGEKGWGTIGYNHAYVAAQVLMLVSLRIHLALEQKNVFSNTTFLLISIVACFLSGSRAGLAGMLVFAIVYWRQQPKYAFIGFTTAILAMLVAFIVGLQTVNFEDSIIERQKTLFEANKAENLSGRDEIWIQRVNFLDKEPVRWLTGTGFGSAITFDQNAHMLCLQIILETGLVGLAIFVFLFYKILHFLYLYEPGVKPIFWVTIALLVTSATQETFYPVPALGHFIGFYLCSIAIALRYRFFNSTELRSGRLLNEQQIEFHSHS